MIRLQLEDGRVFELEEEARISVGDEEFQAADVQQILLVEPAVSVLEGRVTGTALRRLGLRFVDNPTGIAITVPLQPDEARALGERLLSPQILIPGQ